MVIYPGTTHASGHATPTELVMGPGCNSIRERKSFVTTFDGDPSEEWVASVIQALAPHPRPDRPKFKRDVTRSRGEDGKLIVTVTDSWQA